MEREFARLVVARGSRVWIRRKHPGDVHADWRWRTDPEICRYDGLEPLTIPFSEFAAQHYAQAITPNPHREMFALVTPEGRHFGNIMVYNVASHRDEAEIGVSIGDEVDRGQGVGTEAVVLFLKFLFDSTPLRSVILHTFEWNERAVASFRKAGFEAAERVQRSDNQFFLRMRVRREWWLMWEAEGRFATAGT